MRGEGERGAPATSGPGCGVRRGLRARLFAWALRRAADGQHRLYDSLKRDLFTRLPEPLAGALTVVEVGAGAGPNAAYLPTGTCWIAVEPNVHFHASLEQAAADHGLHLDLVGGTAEALPLPTASADAVVSTLVLCSVTDVRRSLAEMRRVLRPGGRVLFLEHVAAPPGTLRRRAQRLVRRPWGWLADGCRPDQETDRLLREAGFASVEVEPARVPLGLASPHVVGVATA